MQDLKQRAIRGGVARICSQGTGFLLRIGSLMILARLLEPHDFGLVGMVTAVTGVFSVLRDFGLSAAVVQQPTVTDQQASSLFWINVLAGVMLGLASLAIAPFLVFLYHEPRLFGITAILALGFLFSSAGVQHAAILQREMRFTTLAAIDTWCLLISTAVGIGMAVRGFAYWALVAAAIVTPFVYTISVWVSTAWIPGKPERAANIRSLLRFGGTSTLNGIVSYVVTNFEKVLLGRVWGAGAVGLYGRAYQLINIPTDNLNSAAGGVAFAALSRLQDDTPRFRSYFLKGYALILSVTVPITVMCALFANDMIAVFLGAKWSSAAPIFRLLAPTVLAFAILNPLGWLLSSLGLVGRALKMAIVAAPVMIGAYVIGLPYGPKGVAVAYSIGMAVLTIPLLTWAVRGTLISVRDIFLGAARPVLAGITAAAFAAGLQLFYRPAVSPLRRLILEVSVVTIAYLGMLLFVMGQKLFYVDLLRTLSTGARPRNTPPPGHGYGCRDLVDPAVD